MAHFCTTFSTLCWSAYLFSTFIGGFSYGEWLWGKLKLEGELPMMCGLIQMKERMIKLTEEPFSSGVFSRICRDTAINHGFLMPKPNGVHIGSNWLWKFRSGCALKTFVLGLVCILLMTRELNQSSGIWFLLSAYWSTLNQVQTEIQLLLILISRCLMSGHLGWVSPNWGFWEGHLCVGLPVHHICRALTSRRITRLSVVVVVG